MTSIYNSPLHFNIPKIAFKNNSPAIYSPQTAPAQDGFSSNPLYNESFNVAIIEAEAKANPEIVNMLREHNLPVKINKQELDKLKTGHLQDTRIVAAKIYSELPKDLKEQVNLKDLQEAAMLHDFGKILIPNNVLNKEGSLNEEERKIVELHPELGYQLLKNKGLSQNTLNLIRYHHQNPDGSGYPDMGDYEFGIDTQILKAADEYTALKEKRSYKNEYSTDDALNIIKEDADSGYIDKEIYNALEKVV